jgi:hypothetical protein
MGRDREAEKAASQRIFFGVGETAHWNLWVLNNIIFFAPASPFINSHRSRTAGMNERMSC